MSVHRIAHPSMAERKAEEFDRSIANFSERYADQNEHDFQEFVNAVQSGRLEALQGV